MSKILIVEDEEAIADLEKDYLELSDFEVTIENRGDTGLQTALSGEFDLVILDLMLPGMDGFEVCRHIREKKDLPVLMVSAKKDDIDKIRGLGLGADDYITKPFNVMEIKARVNAILRRIEKSRNIIAQKQLADITINFLSRKVTKNAQEITLTSKEFDLLYLLIDNPNKVFSREELLEKVWKYEHFGDLRTVDVHVRKLREKIEENSSNPVHIMTKWGEGYYFDYKKE